MLMNISSIGKHGGFARRHNGALRTQPFPDGERATREIMDRPVGDAAILRPIRLAAIAAQF